MKTDIAEAIKNPAAYGFRFSMETVSREDGNTKVAVGTGPIVIVTDREKFAAAFPGAIESALNGSSIRVRSQGPVRRALIKDKKTSLETLQVRSLSAAVGVTAEQLPPEVRVPDGTPEETINMLLAQGMKVVIVYADGTTGEPELVTEE